MIKDNIKAYAHLLRGVLTVSRVMIFEKFTFVFFFFYVLLVLSIALILSVLHWIIAVAMVLFGLFVFVKALAGFQFLKRSLIRRGDRIEYADPYAKDNSQLFKHATVIVKMRHEEAKKSKLISEELMEGNRHFYLVKTDDKPTVIAYDWILGLSPELLDIEFED